ncbi:MAG: A24 family peptidase [Nanoarchaeota archaeon]
MEEYYFLFLLAFVYAIIASINDLRKTEVANWISFSFIAFALSYRVFFSIFHKDLNFLIFGLLGAVFFFLIANVFYYTKVFGGGDAKFLIGFGLIIPFNSYFDIIISGFGFVFLLFLIGTIYTLIYSVFIAFANKDKFKSAFVKKFREKKKLFLLSFVLIVLLLLETIYLRSNYSFWYFSAAFLLFVPLLYIYLKSLEQGCMIRFVGPEKLTVGDWLEKEVKVGNKTIRKSVHGLSSKEINILTKTGKKVWIRFGVPFVPAFLFTLLVMVFFLAILKFDFQNFLLSLF